MKLHGDVPEEHKQLARELAEMETFFDSKVASMPLEMIAKGYVCLAHDWYAIGDEEEGHRLLSKADRAFPGYFDGQMNLEASGDPEFQRLVNSLRVYLNKLLTGNL